jgi:hypothetical protein
MLKSLLVLVVLLPALPAFAAPPTSPQIQRIYQHLEEKAAAKPARSGLDEPQRDRLFDLTLRHPVARAEALPHYDPTGAIGFCFGRAMAAHLIARRFGLAEGAIRKLFVLGDMRELGATKTQWRFHVTTVVAGTDGAWYAVDPILYHVRPISDWIRQVTRIWDNPRRCHFYLVKANVVLPDITRVPPLAQETGERIMELSFVPDGRPGFTPRSDLGPRSFELADAPQATHFISASGEHPFDFTGITTNTRTYSYNNYFFDLLTSLDQATDEELEAARRFTRTLSSGLRVRPSVTPARPRSLGLGSPRFWE